MVNAKHDLATPLPGARRMAQEFPKGRLAVLDAVDHWLYRECQSPLPGAGGRHLSPYAEDATAAGTVYPPR